MMKQDMVSRQSVTAMVGAYEQAEAEIRQAYALLEQAQGRLHVAFTQSSGFGYSSFDVNIRDCHFVGVAGSDLVVKRIHRAAWSALVDRMNVKGVMSQARRRKLDDQLRDGELPPLTEANIYAMVEDTAGQIRSFMDESVVEVYDWLHPGSIHVTNAKFEVGKKVVRPYCVDRRYSGGGYQVKYDRRENLRSLDIVFHLLDGAGLPRDHYGPLVTAIDAVDRSGVGETQYFKFKCYKNNNLHLEFKRLDLLARFNAIAGGSGRVKGGFSR